MNINNAIDILARHNEWRRGAEIDMIDPIDIGIATSTVCEYARNQIKKESTMATKKVVAKKPAPAKKK